MQVFALSYSIELLAVSHIKVRAPDMDTATGITCAFFAENYDTLRWKIIEDSASRAAMGIFCTGQSPIEALAAAAISVDLALQNPSKYSAPEDVLRRLTPHLSGFLRVSCPGATDSSQHELDGWMSMWIPASYATRIIAYNYAEALQHARNLMHDHHRSLTWHLHLEEAHSPTLRFIEEGAQSAIGEIAYVDLPTMEICRRIDCEITQAVLDRHVKEPPRRSISFLTMKPDTSFSALSPDDAALAQTARRCRRP